MNPALKQTTIRVALEAISALRLGKLFPTAAGRGVIFTLHHVRPKTTTAFDPNAHLEITPEFLEEAIVASKAAGLTPVHLKDLPSLLANKTDTKRYVCFTLDDGYKNNAARAAPVFRKHNAPYTIFICPGFVTRTRSMWWETVATLLAQHNDLHFNFGSGLERRAIATQASKQKAFNDFAQFIATSDENTGVEKIDTWARSLSFDPLSIVREETMDANELRALSNDDLCTLGGHTLTHCNLARVSAARLHDEIKTSCQLVEGYSGKPVETFAYPYGWKAAATLREFEQAKALGLKVAVTTQPGILHSTDVENLTGLHRISLNGHFQKRNLVEALITGLPFRRA